MSRQVHVNGPLSPALVLLDTVMVLGIGAVALSPLEAVYAGHRWAITAVVGILLGIGATLLARALRWGPLLTGLLLAVLYLLVGPAAAAPDQAIAGVLPSVDAERTVVTGIVESWRSALTLPAPLGSARGELVVPFVIGLVGSALAATLLWRSRVPGAVALALGAMFVTAAAFGSHTDGFPVLRGAALVILLLAWTRWRSLRHVRTSWTRRLALGLAVASVAGVAGWGFAAVAADPDHREVLRDHVEPPLARLDFKSPLSRYRDFYKRHKTDTLFTISGLPPDALVRLATMDSFDGIVWNVATTDLVTGTSAFRPAPASSSGSAIEVTIGDYDGPWIPTVGTATAATLDDDGEPSARRELLLNTATGSLAEYGDARAGDVYRVDWSPRADRDNQILDAPADRSITVPPMTFAPIEDLDTLATKWVSRSGATNDFERAVALEKAFHQEGYFNDGVGAANARERGASPSGHGARRLADLAADESRMVGNDEQYASAMAYAAQRIGLPARVVMGFEKVAPDGVVTGDDIAAWVEIPFEGKGWVPFDPTPDENRVPPPQDDSPDPVPQPYVVQPPVLPQEPADIQGVPPEGAGRDLSDRIWDLIVRVLGILWLLVKVAFWLSPLWLILLVKHLRRRRRRRATHPLTRISGGWREVTDRARDLGARVPAGHTRYEAGVVLSQRFPASEPLGLATTADRHLFGPGQPTPEEVDAYWADVQTALARMRSEVPWWRRVLGWFSPASIPWREAGSAVQDKMSAVGGRVAARTGPVRSRLRGRLVRRRKS